MTRVFDIFISLAGLIILSPVVIVIALCIKLDSKGPVFFSQNRVGKGGREFKLFKFRSMTIHQSGLLITIGKDPRITAVGSFLRRYKLDELPQLYNVLIGDMSIVGPRPEVKHYVDLYNEEQRSILVVKPGITDFASVKYKNEDEILSLQPDPEKYYIEHIMPEKIKLNHIFITSPTVYNYFSIIFLTIKKVIISR